MKIWTNEQLPMVQELVKDGRIPKAVADESLRVVSILDDTICTDDGITWSSILYLVSNDYGITLIYPYRNTEK